MFTIIKQMKFIKKLIFAIKSIKDCYQKLFCLVESLILFDEGYFFVKRGNLE